VGRIWPAQIGLGLPTLSRTQGREIAPRRWRHRTFWRAAEWKGGQRVGEEDGVEGHPIWGGGEEKAHGCGCSTALRLSQRRPAGGEAGHPGELVSEHHSIAAEREDEETAPDSSRGGWHWGGARQHTTHRGIRVERVTRSRWRPVEGSERGSTSAWFSSA
jgi:hypothetical protein